jgi:hypothetical protein
MNKQKKKKSSESAPARTGKTQLLAACAASTVYDQLYAGKEPNVLVLCRQSEQVLK